MSSPKPKSTRSSAARSLELLDRGLAQPLRLLLRVYHILISPLLGPHCRFEPSCSRYAAEALDRFGLVRGAALSVWRVVRCHPWSAGGHDPVPEATRHG